MSQFDLRKGRNFGRMDGAPLSIEEALAADRRHVARNAAYIDECQRRDASVLAAGYASALEELWAAKPRRYAHDLLETSELSGPAVARISQDPVGRVILAAISGETPSVADVAACHTGTASPEVFNVSRMQDARVRALRARCVAAVAADPAWLAAAAAVRAGRGPGKAPAVYAALVLDMLCRRGGAWVIA